eukprot:jgi/Ulvmu1/3363/UM156_0020.1
MCMISCHAVLFIALSSEICLHASSMLRALGPTLAPRLHRFKSARSLRCCGGGAGGVAVGMRCCCQITRSGFAITQPLPHHCADGCAYATAQHCMKLLWFAAGMIMIEFSFKFED